MTPPEAPSLHRRLEAAGIDLGAIESGWPKGAALIGEDFAHRLEDAIADVIDATFQAEGASDAGGFADLRVATRLRVCDALARLLAPIAGDIRYETTASPMWDDVYGRFTPTMAGHDGLSPAGRCQGASEGGAAG